MKKDISKKNISILIVVPTKNEEKNISLCLNSVLSQNYPQDNYFCVVVDNGSTDSTLEIVSKFEKDNKIATTILPHGTISAVRNFGAKYKDSQYIAFLDGDCIADRNWLMEGVLLLENKNVSCVGFALTPPSPMDSWVVQAWHSMSSGSKYEGICKVPWLSSFNLIVKRVFFEKIGGFDETLETCEDWDFGNRLSAISTLIYSDKISITHLGTTQTLKDFFMKELWRGKSNWRAFVKSTNKRSNSLSVIVPAIYLFLCTQTFILLFANIKYFFLSLFVLMVVPFLLALRKIKKSNFQWFPQISFLYSVYLFARGLAIFKK